MTRYIVPALRRCVQVLSLALLLALPLLALYTHFREAHAIEDLPAGAWRTTVVRGIDDVIGQDQQRRKWSDETQGTFWSARILGVSLSDPLAGAETIVSSRSFYRPLLASLLLPVLATLILGRVFCGWICPMNTLLEVVDRCRRWLRIVEIRERDVKFSRWNKYVLLAAGLVFVGITSVPFLALVYPPAVISREVHLFVMGAGIGLGTYLILAVCAIELFVSKRWWCRYVCPGGALYSLLGRFRLVRIRRDADKCVSCGECVRVCQFDLRPMLVELTGMECTNCASCISHCDSNALRYQLVLPLPGGRDQDRPAAKDFQTDSSAHTPSMTKSLTLLLAVAAATASWPSTALAHHILGLPHYSYKENYPQTPTLEYPATTGPYDVLMTSYPGTPLPRQAANIAFYIKDHNTSKPYSQPVSMRVLKTATFGANETVYPSETHEPFDNQHKYTVTFPEDGEYIVELTMDVEGKTEVIPFLMIAGQPTATKSIIVSLGIGLALFLVVVRAIRKKRDRRRAAAAAAISSSPSIDTDIDPVVLASEEAGA